MESVMKLDSKQLKRIAFVCMCAGYAAALIPGIPVWFGWIGRISIPLFLFCSAWGFVYTSSRKKYILRLYIFSLLTAVVQCICHVDYNFIQTIFSVIVLLEVIEQSGKKPKIFIGYMVWQIAAACICLSSIQASSADTETFCFYILPVLFGSVISLEGGFIYVILGIIFYCYRENKKKLGIAFSLFTLICFICNQFSIIYRVLYKLPYISWNGLDSVQDILFSFVDWFGFPEGYPKSPLFENNQWMMIFSLPLILLYNGKISREGKTEKMFYYCAYPLLLMLLCFLGRVVV